MSPAIPCKLILYCSLPHITAFSSRRNFDLCSQCCGATYRTTQEDASWCSGTLRKSQVASSRTLTRTLSRAGIDASHGRKGYGMWRGRKFYYRTIILVSLLLRRESSPKYLNRKGIHVSLDDRSAGDSTERSCKSTLSKDIGGRQVRYRATCMRSHTNSSDCIGRWHDDLVDQPYARIHRLRYWHHGA